MHTHVTYVLVCLQLPQLVTVLPCEQMCRRPVGEREGGVASVLYVCAAELTTSPDRYEPGVFGLLRLRYADDHTL